MKNLFTRVFSYVFFFAFMSTSSEVMAFEFFKSKKESYIPSINESKERGELVLKNLQEYIESTIYIVEVFRKEKSPILAVTSEKDMCIVVLNTNEEAWALWEIFMVGLSTEEKINMVELGIAHEIGHCKEYEMLSKNSDNKMISLSEKFADEYAIAYSLMYMGDSSSVVIQKLLQVRKDLESVFYNSHNTFLHSKDVFLRLKDLSHGQEGCPHLFMSSN